MSQKLAFLAVIPDKIGMLKTRIALRGEHLEKLKLLTDKKLVNYAGPFFSSDPTGLSGEDIPFKGSVLIFNTKSIEETWDYIKKDPYTLNGVWDIEKATVNPMWPVVE